MKNLLSAIKSSIAAVILVTAFFSSINLSAQRKPVNVYIVGNQNEKPGYIKNGKWISLPVETSRKDGMKAKATAIAVSGKDVYVAGAHYTGWDSSPKDMTPGYWKNGVWKDLSTEGFSDWDTYHFPGSIFVTGNNIYITSRVGVWINGKYIKDENLGDIHSMFSDGSNIYTTDGYYKPGYWLNKKFTELKMAENMEWTERPSMFIYKKGPDLYVTGSMVRGCGEDYDTGYWKNGTWISLKSLLEESEASNTSSITFINNDLYVGLTSYSGAAYLKNKQVNNLNLPEDFKTEQVYISEN